MKKNKKILILNYEYPPLWWWAGVVSQKYAEWLAQLWNKITVITTWFEGEKEVSEKENLKTIRLKSRRKKAFQSNPIEMLSWAFKTKKFLKNYLKEKNFDICIAFFSIPGGIVGKWIFEKYKIPYIVSTHWHDIPGFYPEKMKKFHILTNWYTRKVWKHAKKILVLTSEMKKLADNFWNLEKNIILPNGCYSDFFYPDFEKKNKKFTLIFLGRLVDQKDPFCMLKAIKILKNKNIDFTLYLIWDGALRWEIETYIRENNLQKNVNLTGWISKAELREYYQKSHIQICSSKVEAMSIAILESLYSWLYILSTPVSGNTDMIQEWKNWEFFENWDYETLAKKLDYWSENYKNLEIDENFILEIKEKYDWKKIISDLEKIIYEI